MTVTVIHNLAHLSDTERAKAAEWWASLTPADQMRRKEHANALRHPFGLELPEEEADWPSGETWAEVCYYDANA